MFRELRSPDLLGASDQAVWLQRSHFAAWSVGRDRIGWILWGQLGIERAEEGKQIWLAAARRLSRPYDMVVDLRALETISQRTYEGLREFVVTPKPGLRRQALLVGDAQPGAVGLGLYALAPPSHKLRAHRSAAAAARWLGWPDGTEIFSAVETRLRERLQEPPLLQSVRRRADEDLQRGQIPDLTRTATALAMSSRGLQRALTNLGTSFSEQLDHVRAAHARSLLSEPSAKVLAVARAVGFADAKGLVRLFRRVHGQTPRELRELIGDEEE